MTHGAAEKAAAARIVDDEGDMSFAAECEFYKWLYSLPVEREKERNGL